MWPPDRVSYKTLPAACRMHAALAQLVEHLTRNEKVVSSILTGGSYKQRDRGLWAPVLFAVCTRWRPLPVFAPLSLYGAGQFRAAQAAVDVETSGHHRSESEVCVTLQGRVH